MNRKPPPTRDPLPPPPPKRTREEAMREFEHACRAWFSCMLTPTERNDALQRAIEIANEFRSSPTGRRGQHEWKIQPAPTIKLHWNTLAALLV